MPWRVTLTGADTGSEYIYEVNLPLGTPEHIAYNAAAEQHGRLLGDERSPVTERFRVPITRQWIDT